MLQPKVLDVMQKDYVTVEPKFIRSSAAANLLKRGYRMYNGGNYEGTVTTLTQAIERDSKDVMSYFWRGVAEARLGQYLKSVKDFDAALALQTAASAEHEASLLASNAATRKRSSQSNAEHLLAPILFNRALSSMNVGDDEAALRDLSELIGSTRTTPTTCVSARSSAGAATSGSARTTTTWSCATTRCARAC